MNDEIKQLSEKLSKLSVRCAEIISELQDIEHKHEKVEEKLKKAKKEPTSELTGRDAKGNSLRAGDSVRTMTQGKYYERIAIVVRIKAENCINIEYTQSGKPTWRAGHHFLKV